MDLVCGPAALRKTKEIIIWKWMSCCSCRSKTILETESFTDIFFKSEKTDDLYDNFTIRKTINYVIVKVKKIEILIRIKLQIITKEI